MASKFEDVILRLSQSAQPLLLRVKARMFDLVIVGIYGASLSAFGVSVQRDNYGVLKLAAWFAFAIFLVTWYLEDQPDLVKELTFARFVERRYWHMAAVFALPVAFSWYQNEALTGALSPASYWKDEATAVGQRCGLWTSLVASSADSLRVEQNKYGMGIATLSEVQSSAFAFKVISDSYNNCLDEQRKRRGEVTANLKRLGLDKVVSVR